MPLPSPTATWQGLRDLYANPRDTLNSAIDRGMATQTVGWDENGNSPMINRVNDVVRPLLTRFPGVGGRFHYRFGQCRTPRGTLNERPPPIGFASLSHISCWKPEYFRRGIPMRRP
jgi:hypothetical protein